MALHYINENISRALHCFLQPKSLAENISDACGYINTIGAKANYQEFMRERTIELFESISPLKRLGKKWDEVNDDEWCGIAETLMTVLRLASEDSGLVKAGCNPKDFDESGNIIKGKAANS